MLVSLIIATKNRPERLQKALHFLKQQDYQHWEAIITDDGDGRGKSLADSEADSRIKGYMNAGTGQVDARNTSVTFANGDLLALHDDDDWWEDSDHLSKVVQAFTDNSGSLTQVILHRYGWVVTEEHGQELNRQHFGFPTSAESLKKNNTVLTSSIVYPRRFHQEQGLFDRAVDGYFDWDWLLRVITAGYPVSAIETPGVCYLQHGANGSKLIESDRRLRNFQVFKEKHDLDIVIKNHASFLEDE